MSDAAMDQMPAFGGAAPKKKPEEKKQRTAPAAWQMGFGPMAPPLVEVEPEVPPVPKQPPEKPAEWYRDPEVMGALMEAEDIDAALKISGDFNYALKVWGDISPEEAARVLAIARKIKLPKSTIKRRIGTVEQMVQAQETLKKLLAMDEKGRFRNPYTASFLIAPDHTPVARDDVDLLQHVEDLRWYHTSSLLDRLLYELGGGFKGAGKSILNTLSYPFEDTPEERQKMAKFNPWEMRFGTIRPQKDNLFGALAKLPALQHRPLPTKGFERFMGDVLHVIPQILPGMVGGALWGPAKGAAIAGATIWSLVFGSTREELLAQGVSESRASVLAFLNATGQGALEALMAKKWLNLVFGKKWKTWKALGLEFVGNVFKESATEAIQEFMDVASEIGGEVEGEKGFFAELEAFAEKYVERLPDTLGRAAYAGAVMLPYGFLGGAAAVVSQELHRHYQSKQDAELARQVMASIGQSKLLERDPEAAADFVQGRMEQEGISVAYVPAEALEQHFQRKRERGEPDPASKDLEDLLLTPEEYQDALAHRDYIPVLVGRWITYVTREHAEKQLGMQAGWRPEGVAEVDMEAHERLTERLVTRQAEQLTEQEDIREELAEVRRELKDWAKRLGKTAEVADRYTELYLAGALRIAERRGEHPLETLRRINLHVRTGAPPPVSLGRGPEALTGGLVYAATGEVRTTNQRWRDWFRQSEAVDVKGKPKRYYAGAAPPWAGEKGYFSPAPPGGRPVGMVAVPVGPAFLRVEKALELSEYEKRLHEAAGKALEELSPKERENAQGKVDAQLLEEGYDAIRTPEGGYAVLTADQIRSVFNIPAEAPEAQKIAGDVAEKLDPSAVAGVTRDDQGQIVFNSDEAARGLRRGKEYYQGIETPTPEGRFYRGKKGKQQVPADRQVTRELKGAKLYKWDGARTANAAYKKAQNLQWLDPNVTDEKKDMRYPSKLKGYWGNAKMAHPNPSYPEGRNTYDYVGCGRIAYYLLNDLPSDKQGACYGGKCYAERQLKAHEGTQASVAGGVRKISLHPSQKAVRHEMNAYWQKRGGDEKALEVVRKKWPQFVIGINTTPSSSNYGKLSIATEYRIPIAKVSTNLQPAKEIDIRLGIDTDGAAWLSDRRVLDALLEADPGIVSVYTSAYYNPPPPHPLSGRTIINVIVSGWHPLVETLGRLRWAELARNNGWNVVLREVTADPDTFGVDVAAMYNRLHGALLTTDFFIQQQALHVDAVHGKNLWGLPGCCVGSSQNPNTCDSCEVAEGTGRKFADYWDINEEPNNPEEQLFPDFGPRTYWQAEPGEAREHYQRRLDPLGFYSKLEDAVDDMDFKAMPPDQLAARIRKLPGVKKEELEWTGVLDWLKAEKERGTKKISREHILAFLSARGVQIEEVVRGEGPPHVFGTPEEQEAALARRQSALQAVRDAEVGTDAFESAVRELGAAERALRDIVPGWGRAEGQQELPTRYEQYTTPGGEGYREVLLILPGPRYEYVGTLEDLTTQEEALERRYNALPPTWERTQEQIRQAAEWSAEIADIAERIAQLKAAQRETYYTPHWKEKNVLAHLRIQSFVDKDGRRVLLIEEIQSDWHQEGKKRGYVTRETQKKIAGRKRAERAFNAFREEMRQKYGLTFWGNKAFQESADKARYDELEEAIAPLPPRGMPDAPFKGNAWIMLCLKRALRMAAEEGYDALAWTTGEVQAERYNLSKHVGRIQFYTRPPTERAEEGGRVTAEYRVDVWTPRGSLLGPGGRGIMPNVFKASELEEYFGKELAQKIIDNATDEKQTFEGLDLKVGGEGMRVFYDRVLPNELKKYARKLDKEAKIKKGEINVGADRWEVVSERGGSVVEHAVYSRERAEELAEEWTEETGREFSAREVFKGEEAWELPLTERIKDEVLAGQALFQEGRDALGRTIFEETETIVELFSTANLSTFLHEMGHLFTAELERIIQDGLGDAQTIADYETLKEFAGGKLDKKGHDKIAKAFEHYLMTGRAPTNKLRDAFRRFAEWLKTVYGRAKNIGVEINRELSAVFDRMLASEAEIAQAHEHFLATDLAAALDLTERRRKELRGMSEDALRAARERRFSRWLEAYFEAQGRGEQLRAQAERNVADKPIYAIVDEITEAGGLDEIEVLETWGEDAVEALRERHGESFVREDGAIGVQEATTLNNYAGPQDLFEGLMTALPRGEALQAEYDRLMREEERLIRESLFGEEGAATLDLANDEHLARLLAETQELRDRVKGGRGKLQSLKAMREQQRAALLELPTRAAIRVDIHGRAAHKAANEAYELAKEGKYAEALVAKYQHLRMYCRMREAIRLRRQIEKIERDWGIQKLLPRVENTEGDHAEAAKDLITSFRIALTESLTPRQAAAKLPLPGPEEGFAGPLPDLEEMISDWIIAKQLPEGYKGPRDLTARQFMELADALQVILTRGSLQLRALKTAQAENVQQLIDLMVARMAEHVRGPKRDVRSIAGKIAEGLDALVHRMIQTEMLCEIADGSPLSRGEGFGPLRNAWLPINQADARTEVMLEDKMSELMPAVRTLSKAKERLIETYGKTKGRRRSELTRLPLAMPEALTKEYGYEYYDPGMLLEMSFHLGNFQNQFVLQQGYGLEDAQIDVLKDGLWTDEEWDAIQQVGNVLESLYPELAEVVHRTTGRRLLKVQPTPFDVTTADGQTKHLEGWYYPLVHDHRLDPRAARYREQDDAKELITAHHAAVMRSSRPRAGQTIERLVDKEGNPVAKKPVVLNRHVLLRHLRDTVHLITHAEPLLEFDKVTRDERFRRAFTEKMGRQAYATIRDMISHVARPQEGLVGMGPMSRSLMKLRSLSTGAILKMRVITGYKQRLSMWDAVDAMSNSGPRAWKHLLRGAQLAGLPGSTLPRQLGGRVVPMAAFLSPLGFAKRAQVDRVYRLSEYMHGRSMSAGDREIRDYFSKFQDIPKVYRLAGQEFTWADVREFGWGLIKLNDEATVTTIWYGALSQALAENIGGVTADMAAQERIETAVKYADSIVRTSQPSSLPSDLTRWQGDHGAWIKLFTSFMSYTAKRGARLLSYIKAARLKDTKARLFWKTILTSFLFSAWTRMLLRHLVYADPDEPSWLDWLLGGPIDEAVSFVPILRNAPRAFEYGSDVLESPAGEPIRRGIQTGRRVGTAVRRGRPEDWVGVLWETYRFSEYIHQMPIGNVISDAIKLYERISGQKASPPELRVLRR